MTITNLEDAVRAEATPLLIVENNDLDVERVLRMLRRLDARNPLVHAIDGQQALDKLRAIEPDELGRRRFGMLVDLNMPRMNGFELIEELHRDPAIHPACVYIVTTSNRHDDRSRASELGADGYLLKPLGAEDLADVLAQIGEPVAAQDDEGSPSTVDRLLMAIDDDDLMLERLRRNLIGSGWTFEGFTSADLLIQRLATHRPAALLVDHRMPRTDGHTLLSLIRTNRLLDDTRAILMSEVAPPQSVVEMLQPLGVVTMKKDDVADKDILLTMLDALGQAADED